MSNIIDKTYFERGNIYIPNHSDVNVEDVWTDNGDTDLEHFISKYERELLLNALGVTLYDELQVALDDIENAEQKWIDLINGRNYTNSQGKTRRWDGLKGNDKQSLIAFYIFTEYLRNDHETYATVGTVKSTAKNAEIINSTPKFIKAYNQFIKLYQGGCNFNESIIVVNGFGSLGFDFYNESVNVSLFTYLVDCNEEDDTSFPDFEFKFYASQNSFGI